MRISHGRCQARRLVCCRKFRFFCPSGLGRFSAALCVWESYVARLAQAAVFCVYRVLLMRHFVFWGWCSFSATSSISSASPLTQPISPASSSHQSDLLRQLISPRRPPSPAQPDQNRTPTQPRTVLACSIFIGFLGCRRSQNSRPNVSVASFGSRSLKPEPPLPRLWRPALSKN